MQRQSLSGYLLRVFFYGVTNIVVTILLAAIIVFPLLMASGGGGLGGFLMVRIALPFYLITETLLATFFVYRNMLPIQPSSLSKPASAILIFVIFILTQGTAVFAPSYIGDAWERYQNPILLGKQTYDYSNQVIVHKRKSAKRLIQVQGNKILWEEHVEDSPNTWDLFLFEFNPTDSSGDITRITDTSFGQSDFLSESKLYNDKVYYRLDSEFYLYNPATKQTETITENDFRGVPTNTLDPYNLRGYPLQDGYVVKTSTSHLDINNTFIVIEKSY